MPPREDGRDDRLLTTLPYSLAAPLALVEHGTHPLQRLYLLVHAYRHLIRFLALCLLCDYLQYPALQEPRGTALLTGLQRPSLGHWLRLLRELPRLFAHKGYPLFLHEWPHCLTVLTTVTASQCVHLDYQAPRIALPLLEAFLALRNVLAHGAAPPDDRMASQLATHYHTLLTTCLRHLPFVQDLTLYRLASAHRGEVHAVLLHGAHGPFAPVRLPKAPCFPTRPHVPECFLGRRSDPTAWLDLSPFYSALPTEHAGTPAAEPLLSFDGWAKPHVYYLGTQQKVASRTMYPAVMTALFPSRPPHPRPWTDTAATIRRQTTDTLGRHLGNQYCPEVYVEPAPCRALVQAFLDGPPKVAGFLLVAESGIGKTAFLCHLAAHWLHHQDAQILPWLIACRHLSAPAPAPTRTTPPGTFGVLGHTLRALTGLPGEAHWPAFLAQLADALQPRGPHPMPHLVLLVDAVNEAPDPCALLQELDLVVGLARRLPWLRCLVTMRQGSYQALQARLAARGLHWPRHARAYMRAPDPQGTPSLTIPLPGFSARASQQAYERYQAQAREDPTVPACLTPYAALSPALHQLLRHPLMLRLFMQTLHHQEASETLSQHELFAAFHRRLTPEQAHTATAIARLCLATARTQFTRDDLATLLHTWHAGQDASTLLVSLDPLEQLIDVGVCLQTGETSYTFCHQRYVEFLFAQELARRHRHPLEVLTTVERLLATPQDHLEEELVAYRLLLTEMLTTQGHLLLPHLVALLPADAFRHFFLPLAFTLKHDHRAAYRAFHAQLAAAQDVAILKAGIEVYRTVCDRPYQLHLLYRLRTLERHDKAQKIAQFHAIRPLILSNRLDEAAAHLTSLAHWAQAHAEERLLLDVYTETGYLAFVTGNAPQAFTAYEQASQVLAGLQAQLTTEEVLVKRWEIIQGKGCTEHNTDMNEACAQSHTAALTITQRLADDAKTALTLVNLADAHWGCHRYGHALRLFQSAMELSRKACYHDALDVAHIGRGIVLWSVGRYDQAKAALRAGVTLARTLDYSWDLAYGMLYQSNLEASMGNMTRAIQTNQAALQRAQALGAAYLTALALVYLIWKYEAVSPGALANQHLLQHCLSLCRQNALQGVTVFASSLRLLNRVVDTTVPDTQVETETHALLSMLEHALPLKGPWELLGLQLMQTIKDQRPAIDTMHVEDCVDMVVESKVLSLEPEDRPIFLSTRKPWGRGTRSPSHTPLTRLAGVNPAMFGTAAFDCDHHNDGPYMKRHDVE